jgi:polysaccharide export outer membrane protein
MKIIAIVSRIFCAAPTALVAAVAAAIGLSSCATPDEFDVYNQEADPHLHAEREAAALGNGPKFFDYEMQRKLSPDALRPSNSDYRVGPGDILEIEIAELKASRMKTTVLPDGMLYFDVAEGIHAAGKTLKEISAELGGQLDSYYTTPVVSVNLNQAESQRFWVLGQVKTPGAYPMTGPTTLLEALSKSGGLFSGEISGETQEVADLDRAIIVRKGEPLPVDFRSLVEYGDMSQNVYLKAGDYIYLPSVQNRAVYVLGAVKKPGPLYFRDDITAISALAQAGGADPTAVVTKAIVIRGSLNQPRVAVCNLHGIQRGYDRDFELRAGDILWVPKSNWTYVNRYLEAVIVTAAQAVAVNEGENLIGAGGNGAEIAINAGL